MDEEDDFLDAAIAKMEVYSRATPKFHNYRDPLPAPLLAERGETLREGRRVPLQVLLHPREGRRLLLRGVPLEEPPGGGERLAAHQPQGEAVAAQVHEAGAGEGRPELGRDGCAN